MKISLFLFIILTTTHSASAKINDVLFCLGQEEKIYHTKKIGGALPKINQNLISEFVQISETLKIKPKYLDLICNGSPYPSSISLLYYMLKYKEDIFHTTAPEGDIVKRSLDKSTMEDLITMGSFQFIKLINLIQAQYKKPGCLLEHIPEMKPLYYRAGIIMQYIGIRKLLAEVKDFEHAFDTLLNYKSLKDCNADPR